MMRFALVDNQRVEATQGLKGVCPVCSQSVVAKCGEQRIHHWAHASKKACDSWWESETEWHRAWKIHFSNEWQEVIQYDEKGEKHIADVRTVHGLVLEFQHSHITPEERTSRENFYKNMVWIVDGTRLKRDFARFSKNIENFRTTSQNGVFLVHFPDECFPKSWLNSQVPVIFDYKDNSSTEPQDNMRACLWCLLPRKAGDCVVIAIQHKYFIAMTINNQLIHGIKSLLDNLQKEFAQAERRRRLVNQQAFSRLLKPSYSRRNRRRF